MMIEQRWKEEEEEGAQKTTKTNLSYIQQERRLEAQTHTPTFPGKRKKEKEKGV